MPTNLERFRADLNALITLGDEMLIDLLLQSRKGKDRLDAKQVKEVKDIEGTFDRMYQQWYTEGSAVIKQLIPDRLVEFQHLYKGDGKRKEINLTTLNIQDWTNGIRAHTSYDGMKAFDDCAAVSMRFQNQLNILKASERRFESSLLDMRQLVYADLLDSELEAAGELLKHGFHRAAGAIAGVVLEKHLGQIAQNHKVTVKKNDPTISELNDVLKAENVFEIPIWRQIQHLGALRNLCDHDKGREPTTEEVQELILGVEKVTKTLF